MKKVIGILAHVDAGKTTLSEAMLYLGGAKRKLGRVDHGDAFLDTDAQERERGITIFSKQAILPLGNHSFTLLDTPGHVDFSAEMERTLSVLDCAILVISGTDGVTVIPTREDAITSAILNSADGDLVAILGKGREEYVIDRNGYRDFSDKRQALFALRLRREKNENNT